MSRCHDGIHTVIRPTRMNHLRRVTGQGCDSCWGTLDELRTRAADSSTNSTSRLEVQPGTVPAPTVTEGGIPLDMIIGRRGKENLASLPEDGEVEKTRGSLPTGRLASEGVRLLQDELAEVTVGALPQRTDALVMGHTDDRLIGQRCSAERG